ncbi:TetR/AcrR family transcriptional regulator [Prolixibacter denitrificans]|uniref:AcrR family transcriptional regulator n=1 Tax=Prolixibacter denitrificans TaxID=1541063 RepID=A0A2P8CAQ4_9BACT|nr:TetR/AcrR family transcriptional regulator [Prolixibacter denitrificans]PSK82049.1 AcrR family transcriptional regulator [Prolixibacter denitrificans]GET22642.1 TetR family transcriptional regulator [Prolixibacter denitrificans]
MYTERQLEIIHTGIKLIAEKGLQGLTIKNLSNAIGISEPAIYRHYKNKKEILVNIIDFFSGSTESNITRIAQSDSSSFDKLRQAFEFQFSRLQKNPALISVISSEEIYQGEDYLKEKIRDITLLVAGKLEEIVKEGQVKKEIRDDVPSSQITIIIMGAMRMMMMKWQLFEQKINLVEEGSKILENVLMLISRKEC